MEKNFILDGNRLIAEFMVPNWELLKDENYNGEIDKKDLWTAASLCNNEIEILTYHKSWDSLIPVVERIKSLYEQGDDSEFTDYILEFFQSSYIFGARIEDEFKLVVEFIKRYNEQENRN